MGNATPAPVCQLRRRSVESAGRRVIAFGPEMPDWGSWQWAGMEVMRELSRHFGTFSYSWGEVPLCDVMFVIEHVPTPESLALVPRTTRIVYCPVDLFGSAEHVASQAAFLRRCSSILIHIVGLANLSKDPPRGFDRPAG